MTTPSETPFARYTIVIRGRFAVYDQQSQDLTPINRKERAILALLACCPDRRRSRQWLQAILWSESETRKAASSFRTAIKNLRQAFGDEAPILEASRHEIWLTEDVHVEEKADQAGQLELLELVDAPDPEFENWLRDTRAADVKPTAIAAPVTPTGPTAGQDAKSGTVVIIRSIKSQGDQGGSFLEAILADTLSARFDAAGAEEIYALSEPSDERLARAATALHLEMVSMVDAGFWTVHLRVLADTDRRFLWSGRLRLHYRPDDLGQSAEIQAFATRAMTQILMRYQSFRGARRSPMMVVSRAASQLYDPNPDRVRAAERDLAKLTGGEGGPVALAWQGFAGLARRLEFGDLQAAEEARELTREALTLRPGNALISALASRVALDVNADLDYAEALAQNALDSDEGDPYALQAASRVALQRGRIGEAHTLAARGRRAADGMPHVFAWDFELCLTALARGDFVTAQDAVRQAYRFNPQHRASLRYLVATSLLVDDQFEAEHAAARLAGLETGFQISDLRRDDYPVLTLRNLGLIDLLPRG